MANTIKTRPSIGDIFMIIDGKKRFVGAIDATTAFLDAHANDCVGVVYDVQGNLFRVVAGVNNTQKKWSCVADYEITVAPSSSGDYAVTLNGTSVGNFSYTASEGTIAEFTTQLNSWLSTNAPKWEAYTANGHSYLQMKTYDAYESTVTIASTTLVKLIGSELATFDQTTNRNSVKQSTAYNGLCRARLKAWAENNTDANCNPTSVINGTTQLFATFPCSKKSYSRCALYKITSVPATGGNYAVALNGVSVGSFAYNLNEGEESTEEKFVSQLNSWLSINEPTWFAYKDTSGSYLCDTNRNFSGSTASIESTTLNEKVQNGVRMLYATYDDYIDACMVRLRELNHGVMKYRDGKLMTDLLYPKTVLVNGVETKAYTAACYAKDYDCGVTGYGEGTFWMPSMYELGLLMRDRTGVTIGDGIDLVNLALSKKTGWSQISISSYRWSCCRYSRSYAWGYNRYGICYSGYFYDTLAVSPVSAFTL